MIDDIKTCPFCGDYANLRTVNYPPKVVIECINEECPVKPYVSITDIKSNQGYDGLYHYDLISVIPDVIKKWNTRK